MPAHYRKDKLGQVRQRGAEGVPEAGEGVVEGEVLAEDQED